MAATRELPHIVLNSGLIWLPSRKVGWHPAEPIEYDEAYFEMYRQRDDTDIGHDLTKFRVGLVNTHAPGCDVIDIGIGGGRFVEAMGCYGYDINPKALELLSGKGLCRAPDFATLHPKALTFWDSIEHIPNPAEMIIAAKPEFIFASLPVFKDAEDAIRSKHYKPGEHIWYWTTPGFVQFMKDMHFELIEINRVENTLGREGIATFAFKRNKNEQAS